MKYMHKVANIKNVFSETMQKEKYVSKLCVLLFLIIEDANVNAQILTSCDNPLENEVCNLTCTTIDHLLNVAFNKEPDPSIIAQCSGVRCFGSSQYSISQPDSVTTVLSFIHSRSNSGSWRCSYGPTPKSVSVPWATYPQRVSTTLTSNTTVDTNIDGNVTLWCLYSEQAPTVTLQYQDANGNNDAMSAETFQCDATDIPCTDVNFTTYECPVVVKEETGIDNTDTYSIKLKIKVAHVQTEDVHTIVTDITFKRSGGANGSTDNDNDNGQAIGILNGCLGIAYIIVIVLVAIRLSIGSTGNTSGNCFLTFCLFIDKKLFDCCGRESSQEGVLTLNSLLGFTYLVLYGVIVEVIVLLAVYYGYSKFQEGLVIGVGFVIVLVLSGLCLLVVWMLMKYVYNDASKNFRLECCISLMSDTVTPHDRQQPDGHEGPQSTPKDPDAGHITTIDTLDEQKTDKKPKDKKKKKKKMKDEEQDNPAYDTEQ